MPSAARPLGVTVDWVDFKELAEFLKGDQRNRLDVEVVDDRCAQRKTEVVTAVRNGRISLDDACRRYMLSIEEFHNWQRLVDMYGVAGLRVTCAQRYRDLKRTS